MSCPTLRGGECRCNRPDGKVHVSCDANCGAFEDPTTEDELRAALEHWRRHAFLAGCSHAR